MIHLNHQNKITQTTHTNTYETLGKTECISKYIENRHFSIFVCKIHRFIVNETKEKKKKNKPKFRDSLHKQHIFIQNKTTITQRKKKST